MIRHCKHSGERAVKVAVRLSASLPACDREARARLQRTLISESRSEELGHFQLDRAERKGRNLIYTFRKSPETR